MALERLKSPVGLCTSALRRAPLLRQQRRQQRMRNAPSSEGFGWCLIDPLHYLQMRLNFRIHTEKIADRMN